MESSPNTISPLNRFYIHILRQKVEGADCSCVYVFVHGSGKIGIGWSPAALSCRDRLQDHLNSFFFFFEKKRT